MRLPPPTATRRRLLHSVALLCASMQGPQHWRSVAAFENRLPPDELELKYKSPRTPGPKPTNLGPYAGNSLQPCIDGKPHCFSSTPETFEDNDLFNADYGATAGWLVEPFKYDKPLSDAFRDIQTAIASYVPGQRGIDGGGFKVFDQKADANSAYVYVQFESRRKGYIDDMEFALKDGICNVRTSSRLGYLDAGVNAKRFNWFADRLGSTAGWRTSPLLRKGHEEYFSLNGVSDSDMMANANAAAIKPGKVKIEGAGFRPPGL